MLIICSEKLSVYSAQWCFFFAWVHVERACRCTIPEEVPEAILGFLFPGVAGGAHLYPHPISQRTLEVALYFPEHRKKVPFLGYMAAGGGVWGPVCNALHPGKVLWNLPWCARTARAVSCKEWLWSARRPANPSFFMALFARGLSIHYFWNSHPLAALTANSPARLKMELDYFMKVITQRGRR